MSSSQVNKPGGNPSLGAFHPRTTPPCLGAAGPAGLHPGDPFTAEAGCLPRSARGLQAEGTVPSPPPLFLGAWPTQILLAFLLAPAAAQGWVLKGLDGGVVLISQSPSTLDGRSRLAPPLCWLRHSHVK